MTYIPHDPGWHILDSTFAEQNQGIITPTRHLVDPETPEMLVCRTADSSSNFNTIVLGDFALRITNLDRDDPPGYAPDSYPRTDAFNNNSGFLFRISAHPRMPVIRIQCDLQGFSPTVYPIYWRLQCRHVMCRHQPGAHYRYTGVCEILEDEWQGTSKSSNFNLFESPTPATLTYDYNTNDDERPVMGGHAILTVSAMPQGCSAPLVDYVHLRIGAANPTKGDVFAYVNSLLSPRNDNLVHMENAIITHENNLKQFSKAPQHSSHMIFKRNRHTDDHQPNCNVLFDWPDDPEYFPSVSFDWGVGIAQYTKTVGITVGREASWDWRANLRIGVNEFLGKLRGKFKAGSTWQEWAHRSWKAYNGSGPAADAYADSVAALPEGQLVSDDEVPHLSHADYQALTRDVPAPPAREAPPEWPLFPGGTCS